MHVKSSLEGETVLFGIVKRYLQILVPKDLQASLKLFLKYLEKSWNFFSQGNWKPCCM